MAQKPTETPKPSPMAARRHPVFLRLVRDRTANRLMKEKGLSRDRAWEAVNSLDDGTILETATAYKVAIPAEGGIIDWISQHGPQLLKLVEALMSLLALFGKAEKPKE